ncbi:hypothetical protein HN836_02625, partial [Candidatus Woesearchaeota archaeon]|nr:hypothetical protein [Candidatus Woesearchaeota archaeon]
ILNSSFITSLPYETPVKYMFSQTHANFNNPSGAYYNNQRSAGDTCVEDSDCNSGACKRELYVHSIDLCKGWNIPFNEEGCMSAIFSCVRDDFQCSKWSSKNYYGFNTGYTESGIYCAGNNLVGVKKNYGKECTENYECRYACANSIDDDKKYCIKDSTSKCSGKDVVGYELNKQLNEYTCLKIGDTSDLNSYYDGILQANNGESCSTNIDCKSNNCLKEIDSENSFCAESGKQCSNQGETGFTIGEKLVVSDSEYYGCTGLSESKLVTENGFACNTNEECGSNNCVKEIDSENSFCADIGKQCSNQGENGFDIGERLTISDTEYYKCTGLSESKLVTENGFACNTNEECGSNNCVKEIDSENLFCADTGKECSKQNENGYEQGNILNGYQCIGLSQSGLASGYDCNSDSDCLTQSCIIDIFDQSQTGKVCELINLASIGVSLSLDEAEGNSYLYENEIGEKIKWYDWSLRNVYGKKTYFYLKNIENIENFDSANLYIKPNNREIEKTYIANKISDTEYRVHIPYNDCYRRNNCLTDYPIDRVENYSYYWILRDKAGKLNKLKTEIFEVTKEEAITPAISIENKLIYTNSKKYDNAVFSDNTITSNYDFKIEINHNGKKEIYDGIRDFYYRPNELGTYTFNLSNNPESEWRFTGYSEKITMEFTKPPYPQLFNYGYMNNQIIFPNKEKPQITQIHEGYQIFNETINLKLILDGQIIDLIKNKEIINDGLNMYFIYDGNKWKQGEYGSSISQQIIINYTDEFEPGKHEIYFSVTDPFGQTTNTPRRTVTVEKKTYDFDIILDGDQLFGAHPLDYSEIIIKKNQDNSVSYKIDIINQNKNLIFTKEISNGIDAKIYYEFPEDGTYTINVTSPETNNYQYINKQQIITVYSIIPSAFIHNQIINYNNPFGQLDDHLFYFEYNTANLIENDKLKSDCSDLRIFEKDTEILINHAIENNCNTVNTKIWMRDDLVGGLNQYILASGNPFVKNSGEKSSLSTEDNFFIQLSKHDSFEKYENDRTNFTMVAIDKVNNIDTTTAKFFFKTPASIYDFNEHTPDYDSLTNSFKYKRVLGPGEYSYYWKIKNDLGHTIESSINTFTVEKNVPNLNLKINENNIENINNIITYDNTKIDYNLIDTEGNIKIQIYDSNNNLFKTLNEFNTITEVFNFTKQGTYNIVYSFDGNNDYSQFSNSFLINVKPERISPEITIQKLETDLIEIEPNKFKYDPNKKIKFIINVTDFSGIKKTIMTINNEETEILVNSNNFETEVIYETNLDAGNYDYYWRAYDNSGNIVNGAGKLFEIEKADYELVTAISTSPEEIINKKVTDKVLIESQIFPQTNYNMKISLNGAEIENKQSISFSQELDLENEGTYTIEFSSIENNNYNPTSKIITINVEKETVPPEISSKNINAPEKYDKETNTVISINANDDYGLKDNALLILNNKEYLVPNNNGIYKFEKVLNASLYTYKWKVLDVFDNFVETEQKTFTIEKRNTHIISNIDGDNANNLNIGLSDQVIINANIMPPYLEYNMKLKYGEEEKINENENNFAEEYIFNNEGLYELNFNYIGDKNHLSNSSIHNIEVAKETEPPTITSNTFTSPNSYDSNTNTIITLSASDNYGIKNKIELILNDIIHEVNLKNENEGVYTFEFNKLLNAGNYNYKWKVLDKFDNLIETELKTFTITKKDPLLNLLINDEFLNKEIIELENIKVISKMVEPVDNYKFIIINKQDDSTYFEYDGEYEQFIAFPQSNEYDIKIVYSGNENYNEKEKKLTVTVTKEKNAPIITRNEFVYNAEYSQDKSIFIVNASDDKGIKSIAELILDQKTINVNRDANELFNYSTILSAGPHSYYWKVYDLNNNLVVTKLETFEILKKTPNIQISIDDSNVDKTIKTFEFFNIKANTIEPNNNDFNYNIYKDNQLISSGVKNNLNDLISNNQVGNYKYEIEYLGNINYSGLKKSMNLNTINEQDKPKINLIEQSSPDTYNSDKSIISLTSSDISGIKSAILNLNNELIEMELLNIEENIFKHKFEKILSAGKYNYNIIIKDNSGNEFLSETKEFIIKKAKAEFNLKLNGQNTDVNIEVGNKLNIKTDIINPSGEEYDMFIFDQNRGIIQEYTYSEYNEIEIDILNENDQYINLTFDGNENYTKSSIEYVVFFNEDITPPRINYDNLEIAMPNSPSKYEIGGKIKFEINASDFSGLKNIAKLNISNTLFDVEYNNGKYSYEIQLQSGEYKYNWIIEDNKNNKVISDTNTHKIQKNSINVTLSFKDNIIKQNTSEKIEAFVNISGNEGLPYEIFFDNEIKKYTQKEKFNITKLKSGVYNLDFKFNETENFYEKIINKTVIFVDDILPLGVKNLNEYNYSNTSTVITFETIETEDFESYEIYVNNELINTSKDINERFYKLYDFVIGTKYTAKVVTKDVNGNKVEQKIDFVFAKDYKPIKVKEIK